VRLLYNVLLVLLSPLVYLVANLNPKLRQGMAERIGHWPRPEQIPQAAGKTVWLHSVSVGEVKLLQPLIGELRKHLPEAAFFATTITPSGREVLDEIARKEKDVVASYFPLADLPWAVARFINAVKPLIYVATEAEAWPNLQALLKRRGVRSLLVNARIYVSHKPAWKLALTKMLLRDFDRIVCQSQEFADAFAQVGVPREKLVVCGNIKSDIAAESWTEEQVTRYKSRLGWPQRKVITAGSTHPGEEEDILEAYRRLHNADPGWALALTPRHPKRGEEVLELAGKLDLAAQLLSRTGAGENHDVLVVDRMGVLLDYYRIADVVILGGTFNPRIGGHNVLEPAHLAKPIIVGPHIDSIAEHVARLRAADAVTEATQERLAKALQSLAADAERRTSLGSRAGTVARSLAGATECTVRVILEELKRT
jgi:3-deoxy-D-manno-octulosonic-acid transferase